MFILALSRFIHLVMGDPAAIQQSKNFVDGLNLQPASKPEAIAVRTTDPFQFTFVFIRLLELGYSPVADATDDECLKLGITKVISETGLRNLVATETATLQPSPNV
ncbi:MAG: hypothetical protein EOP06_15120, partial [Proteobacteria bacterium]